MSIETGKTERVIFVDADQIVKADLGELWRMDLNGAPYGFTPFCHDENANNLTTGHRFWDQGYWNGLLRPQGKRYQAHCGILGAKGTGKVLTLLRPRGRRCVRAYAVC